MPRTIRKTGEKNKVVAKLPDVVVAEIISWSYRKISDGKKVASGEGNCEVLIFKFNFSRKISGIGILEVPSNMLDIKRGRKNKVFFPLNVAVRIENGRANFGLFHRINAQLTKEDFEKVKNLMAS